MTRTNQQRILDYLWSIAPGRATNGRIREGTGIGSHQQVTMLTRELAGGGLIHGEQRGREWEFWADESLAGQLASPGRAAAADVRAGGELTPRQFEDLARAVMGAHLGVPLAPARVGGVPKVFDLVSPDGRVAGDAKYFALVHGQRLPPAKFSIIAEHVWLLSRTGAATTFLVSGSDREVPRLWLARYGHLVGDVAFYFLYDTGELEALTGEPTRGGKPR